jgi:hypothetical protein
MLTQMELKGTELWVTISNDCDYSTACECAREFEGMQHRHIETLHITLVAMAGVPACLIGLMLWLREQTGACHSHLTLTDCDVKLWKLLGMNDIVEQYIRNDAAADARCVRCIEAGTPHPECVNCSTIEAAGYAGNSLPVTAAFSPLSRSEPHPAIEKEQERTW